MPNRLTVSGLLKAVIAITSACVVIALSLTAYESWNRLRTATRISQITDASAIAPIVDRIVAAHPDVIEEIRGGKDRKFQFLVGQVMKETKGKGDPKLVTELLRAAIGA